MAGGDDMVHMTVMMYVTHLAIQHYKMITCQVFLPDLHYTDLSISCSVTTVRIGYSVVV